MNGKELLRMLLLPLCITILMNLQKCLIVISTEKRNCAIFAIKNGTEPHSIPVWLSGRALRQQRKSLWV